MKALQPVGREAYDKDVDEGVEDFDKVDFYWAGIRSTGYFPKYYRQVDVMMKRARVQEWRTWAELVPEPENDYDPLAVAVYSETNVQMGYVGESVARYLHWMLQHLEVCGFVVVVPVLIVTGDVPDGWEEENEELDPSVYMALPTFQVLERHMRRDDADAQLHELWEKTPPDIQDSLVGTFLDQNATLMSYLRSVRETAPLAAIPDTDDPSALPPQLQGFFHDRRHEIRDRRARECLEQQEIAAKEKRLRTSARDDAIALMIREGSSRSEMVRKLGTSVSTIERVARQRGLTLSKVYGGDNDYSSRLAGERIERCLAAAGMADDGEPYILIGRVLGIAPQSVKRLVADGRFYRNPEKYPDRLQTARSVASRPASEESMTKNQKQRVRGDIRALRARNPTLLSTTG